MYKIVNTAEGTEILLYSMIEGGFTAGKLIKTLQASDSTNITLRINSEGGEVFEAIAIYNYLKDKNVHVVIDGLCASAASIVAMSGKKITMKQGSIMMIHNPLTFAIGESEELRAQADILDKIRESIVSIYQTHSNMDHDSLVALMDAETWMNEYEAVNHGFADEIEYLPQNSVIQPEKAPEVSNTAPTPPEPPVPSLTYEDGVKAERERIKALDELYTPGRAKLLDAAKYQTGQTAQEIALEILKAEAKLTPKPSMPEINNFSAKNEHADLDAFIDAVNRKKGR